MNAPGRKNVYSKSTIETPEQTVKFLNTVKFIRTVLELIKVSQLVLGVQFETLNMYFETGLKFDAIRIYLQIRYLYISYFFSVLYRFRVRIICWSIQIPSKHLPIKTQQ